VSRRARARRSGSALFAVVAIASLLIGWPAAAASQQRVVQRASYTDIINDVMCVSCHEPLALAQSPQAIYERNYVKHLVTLGYTKPQIERALVGQYGQAVLGKPPAHGFNLTVYILPPAVVLAGILMLAFTLPKWRRRARAAAHAPIVPAGPALSTADSQRLDEDLARWE
jgi:cytochrome c-type biogenesis protein CcmH